MCSECPYFPALHTANVGCSISTRRGAGKTTSRSSRTFTIYAFKKYVTKLEKYNARPAFRGLGNKNINLTSHLGAMNQFESHNGSSSPAAEAHSPRPPGTASSTMFVLNSRPLSFLFRWAPQTSAQPLGGLSRRPFLFPPCLHQRWNDSHS